MRCIGLRVSRRRDKERDGGTKTNVKGEAGEQVRDAANSKVLDGVLRHPLSAEDTRGFRRLEPTCSGPRI